MSKLFEPFSLRGVTFQNRVWVSPMCQYSAVDGYVGEWHRIHLGSFVTGLPGLVMVEATGVVPEGRISIGCPSIEDQDHANAFVPMLDFAHQHNVKMGIQLAHAGRKASTMRPVDGRLIALSEDGGWQAVAPSPIAYFEYPTPRQLTISEIKDIVRQFGAAAKHAVVAGFDVIEIHAAHGYLLHQFYSPLSNHRTDEYGGNFDGRTKFLREVVSVVRGEIPISMPLFVRISATDWSDGGWQLDDSIQLCSVLRDMGVDLIDVSSGGNLHNAVIPVAPGYQVPFSKSIRSVSKVATTAVGLITDPIQAEEIIVSESADAIFMAREMLRSPRWALYAAEALGAQVNWPIQLRRGKKQV